VCDDWRLAGADVAERFVPLKPGDDRPRQALEVARAYCRGEATAEELEVARNAACDAIVPGPEHARSNTAGIAAQWVAAPEPIWTTPSTPWKMWEAMNRPPMHWDPRRATLRADPGVSDALLDVTGHERRSRPPTVQ
jgi:hypothetical protein